MSNRLRAAGAALMFFSLPAFADDPRPPPVVTPMAETETLPKDGVFETVDLRLGMTWDEAKAALTDLQGSDPREQVGIVTLSDNDRNDFSFRYAMSMDANIKEGDSTKEDLRIIFTTNVNETRAVYIKRYIRDYDGKQEISRAEFLAAIEAKFGPPSAIRDGKDYHWIWFNGARQTLSADDVEQNFTTEGKAAYCTRAWVRDFGQQQEAGYSYGRPELVPYCGTLMTLRIDDGAREDLISGAIIEMLDVTRFNRNLHDTNAWAESEFKKIIEAKGGTVVPKL